MKTTFLRIWLKYTKMTDEFREEKKMYFHLYVNFYRAKETNKQTKGEREKRERENREREREEAGREEGRKGEKKD